MESSAAAHGIHAQVWELVADLWRQNQAYGHGVDHAQRAYQVAEEVCVTEGIDFLPVGAACYLMDAGLNIAVGRHDHIARGIEIAYRVLSDIPELQPYEDLIISGVRHHEADNDIPADLPREVLCARDADTLDRMGAPGINMTLMYGQWHGRELYDKDDPVCARHQPRLNSFSLDYVRHLISLEGRLSLPTARRLGAAKVQEIQLYLAGFAELANREPEISYAQAFDLLTGGIRQYE